MSNKPLEPFKHSALNVWDSLSVGTKALESALEEYDRQMDVM
jgi:hypothetical protein